MNQNREPISGAEPEAPKTLRLYDAEIGALAAAGVFADMHEGRQPLRGYMRGAWVLVLPESIAHVELLAQQEKARAATAISPARAHWHLADAETLSRLCRIMESFVEGRHAPKPSTKPAAEVPAEMPQEMPPEMPVRVCPEHGAFFDTEEARFHDSFCAGKEDDRA